MTSVAGPEDFVIRAIVSFLIGALIGLERERARLASRRTRRLKELPGVRSFGLLCLYGFLTAQVSMLPTPASIAYAALLCFLVAVIVCSYAYYRTVRLSLGGVTTYIVIALSFALGLLIGYGLVVEATAIGVLAALVLASKPYIERCVKLMTYKELLALLEVATFAFVVGPLVANVRVNGFNLWPLYVFFLAVLATSFASYVAVRVKGAEGARFIALCGGLANSEALVASFAALSREGCLSEADLWKATILACTGMYFRNAILALVLLGALPAASWELLAALTLMLTAGGLPFIYAAARAWSRWKGDTLTKVTVESPISWGAAMRAALFYAVVALLSAGILRVVRGASGVLLAAGVGGFVSAAATILSLFTAASMLKLGAAAYPSIVLLASSAALLNKAFYAYLGSKNRGLALRILVLLAPLAAYLAILALALLLYAA